MKRNNDALKSNIIQGFSTLIIREIFIKFLSFIGQVFLARLLNPSDFGVYVIIIFIIGLFGLFSDIGLNLAIIQKKEEPTHQELSGVFWLKVILSLILIILIWFFAPFIKVFYPTFIDANVTMLRVISITLLLTNLRSIPISLLERKIQYNLISLLDILGIFVYYIVALTGAFLNFGVWSFIYGAVIKEIVETIVLYIKQPFLPKFLLSWKKLKNVVGFGVYIQGNNFVSFFITSINPVVGGRLSGPYAVGLLDFANTIASIPNIVAMNFSRVAFAGYSRLQGEKDILSKSIDKSVGILSIVLYIFPVILISFGNELIHYIYTDKWITAVPALYWFSAAVIFYPITTVFGQIILAIGKSKEIFWTSLMITIIGWIGSILLVYKFGFVGIAIMYFFIIAGLFFSYIYILKENHYKFSVFSIAGPQIAALLFTILFSLILNVILPSNIYVLILKLILSAVVYIIFMLVFAKKDTLELIRLFLRLITRKNI